MLGPIDVATFWPFSSWTSAMTMALAPCVAKWRAVASPMPLAPPVIMATLPWSLFFGVVESVISFVRVNQVSESLCYVKNAKTAANYINLLLVIYVLLLTNYSHEKLFQV